MENEIRENRTQATTDQATAKSTAKSDKKTMSERRSSLIVQILNGDILSREFVINNINYLFVVIALLLLIVAKSYYGKQKTKEISELQTEVDAITAEYIENKAHLEEATARYRLVKALERKGLKETVNPAKVIRIQPSEDEW